jgi:hypothetical protein
VVVAADADGLVGVVVADAQAAATIAAVVRIIRSLRIENLLKADYGGSLAQI